MSLIRYTNPNALGIAPTAGLGGRFPRGDIEDQIDWLFGTALAGVNRDAIVEGSLSIQASRKEKACEGESTVPCTPLRRTLDAVNRDAIVEGSLSIQASRKEKSCEGESTVTFNRLVSVQDEVQAYKVSAAYRERHPDRDASQEGEGQAEVDHRVRQLNPGDSENQGETPHHCSTHSSHHSTTARTTTMATLARFAGRISKLTKPTGPTAGRSTCPASPRGARDHR